MGGDRSSVEIRIDPHDLQDRDDILEQAAGQAGTQAPACECLCFDQDVDA